MAFIRPQVVDRYVLIKRARHHGVYAYADAYADAYAYGKGGDAICRFRDAQGVVGAPAQGPTVTIL